MQSEGVVAYIVYLLVVMFGLVYFSSVKRAFDFTSLAFLSAVVYFSPAFAGFIVLPGSPPIVQAIESQTYWVLSTILGVIFLTIILCDVISRNLGFVVNHRIALRNDEHVGEIAAFFAIVSFVALLFNLRDVLASTDKQEVLKAVGRAHIVFEYSISIGALVSFQNRHWKLAFLFFGFLIFDLIIGFRAAAVTTFLAAIVMEMRRLGPIRLIGRFRLLGSMFAALIAALLFKQFLFAIRHGLATGDFSMLRAQAGDPLSYLLAFAQAEPSVTMATLNSIVINRFELPFEHLLTAIISFVPLVNEFGFDVKDFNSKFQPALFPYIEWGMAGNVFAEMFSVGGIWLTALFSFVLAMSAFLGGYLLDATGRSLRAALALAGVYLVFYFHRNDVQFELILERRVLTVYLVLLICSFLFSYVGSSMLRPSGRSSTISAE